MATAHTPSKQSSAPAGISQIQTITPNKPELTVLGKIEQSGDILSAHYSADGNDIFAGSINGEVFHYESRSLKKLNQVEDEEMKNKHSPITSVMPVRINNENKLFTSHVNGWVKIWDAGGNTCLTTVKEKNQILGVIPHSRKEKFLTLGEDAKMRLYDTKTGQLAMTFENSYTKDKMTGHDSKIFAAKFHPKNMNEFISGGWDDTVQFWDMRKPQSIRYFAGAHICGEGLDLDIHGELVLTCAYQPSNTCRLWNYATARPYLVLGAETAKVLADNENLIEPDDLVNLVSQNTALTVIDISGVGAELTNSPHHPAAVDDFIITPDGPSNEEVVLDEIIVSMVDGLGNNSSNIQDAHQGVEDEIMNEEGQVDSFGREKRLFPNQNYGQRIQKMTRDARKNKYGGYRATLLDYSFFDNFSDSSVSRYDSISPGCKNGDPVVTDIRCLEYDKVE